MASSGQRIIRIVAFVNIRCIFDALIRFVLFVKFVVVENNRNFSILINGRITLRVFQKPIKTTTDKEKQVFICFEKLPVFVGFSLFLLVFERLRVGELARE